MEQAVHGARNVAGLLETGAGSADRRPCAVDIADGHGQQADIAERDPDLTAVTESAPDQQAGVEVRPRLLVIPVRAADVSEGVEGQ